MPRISFKGDIIDFHPTKSETLKVTIETELDAETAKLLWLIGKGLDITFSDNQTTLEELERTKINIAADIPEPEEEEGLEWEEEEEE